MNQWYPAIKPRGDVAVFPNPHKRTGTLLAEPSVTAVVKDLKHKDELGTLMSLSPLRSK